MFAETATQCDERSVASLRKTRLQKMRIARNKAKAEFIMGSCTSDLIDNIPSTIPCIPKGFHRIKFKVTFSADPVSYL